MTQSADSMPSAPLRVLVVDALSVSREVIRLMLEPLGLQVHEAGGGAEAIRTCGQTAFDVVLMDVAMPGMDGLQAAREIRATSVPNHGVPIIGLTADETTEATAACRAAGMNDVLAKPVMARELLAKVSRWGHAVESVEQARRMA